MKHHRLWWHPGQSAAHSPLVMHMLNAGKSWSIFSQVCTRSSEKWKFDTMSSLRKLFFRRHLLRQPVGHSGAERIPSKRPQFWSFAPRKGRIYVVPHPSVTFLNSVNPFMSKQITSKKGWRRNRTGRDCTERRNINPSDYSLKGFGFQGLLRSTIKWKFALQSHKLVAKRAGLLTGSEGHTFVNRISLVWQFWTYMQQKERITNVKHSEIQIRPQYRELTEDEVGTGRMA